VQGACDMGCLVNVYPGYQGVADPAFQTKFSAAWGVELSTEVGMTVTEMIPAAGEGRVRAIYIVGENPVMSDPDSNHIRECLAACEFLVLQEIFPTETAAYADVLLPGVSFAEKDGTVTNTERRVQFVRQAVDPVGESRPDWQIICDLAKRVAEDGTRVPDWNAPYAKWNYASPAEVMGEIAALTPIYAGITYERLAQGERLQWPVRSPEQPGTPILHVGTFSRGLGRFHAVEHVPPAEPPDGDYPMILTTGRVLYHWHGGEMTRRARGLMAVYPEALVEVNPEDAQALGLHDGAGVRVTSRRGQVEAKAHVTERVPPGVVFGHFHFPDEQNINLLTIAALDPTAKIPEYKVCAVRVEAIGS
ncbi:MAG: molybdopterin dinucleotide binding domain-containing protein, partial [Anaerolineae bacterium]